MDKPWHLNSREVHKSTGIGTLSIRKNARQPRQMDKRDATINLIHTPTKIEVNGSIPEGHYSKKEMIQLRKSLYKALFIELENKVAKFLKIPKR
jgi:hypothetical protein